MKWFKHDSNSNMDSKLQEILLDYGLEGYGLYFYCLELIASNVERHNLTFELEHDARIIARNTGSSVEKVQQMMSKFIELGLFENANGVITCLKMMSRTDEYTHKLLTNKNKELEGVGTVSGQNPKKSELIEEKRREEKRLEQKRLKAESRRILKERFDKFYAAYPKKVSKGQALKTFKSKIKTQSDFDELMTGLKNHKFNDDRQYIPNPSTWLNAEAWLDEQNNSGGDKFDSMSDMEMIQFLTSKGIQDAHTMNHKTLIYKMRELSE